MRVFRGLPNAESRAPCALTIGNFDGVHRGHQALLAHVRAAADARGLPVCVMTFEPHPREFFNPASAPPRIAMLRDKLEALAANGVDRIVVEHFNHTFASQSPDTFVERIIVNGLHARWVMIGDDFRYGAKRAGDFASLKAAGQQHGFEVEQMATVADPSGARISSSAVRAALSAGQLDVVRAALGRSYQISGHVVHGMKLGRDLGFPTLNVPIQHKRPALAGIFVVLVHGIAEHPLTGVASLGVRPTVDDSGRVLLEAHLLDWHGDAYGKLVRVEFLHKLRDEEKYLDLETLTAAIARDVAHARTWLARNGISPGSGASGFATSATDRIS
ncbi:bifunctional riboflavin kinase/FAD synthetase [Paraburkholderia bonniea]|uniref:bifunctional riboflavin kinase/FAD synthetase n=1 Tax=Paraburkholderia bonniea TaxID=2152891 RepID=UPI0012919972|nr:bifunctional riboflavin kinase/FAD synthetase [Paraburkholderia bonniea]WJF89614.1 bifunctional riboflavin kinase/FAD synthetase [Paraburkholderia bonniea]WJF92928.1 bifunctional riboflavin kinase/FAD synthetase [Paraburkholderia bonniea]